jgi:GntR family transcriptional regulator, transcriptional repressor for pyruvate dehydrogenase complex
MKIKEFQPVVKTNLADIIIDQIITFIKEGKLIVGERAFTERQLAEQFEVSRVTVREATKRLKQMGFLKKGSGNSYVISKPSPEKILEPIIHSIILNENDNKKLVELRRILETNAAVIAIKNATENDIKELFEIVRDMEKNIDDCDVFSEYDYFLHVKIAQATYNPYLFKLITSIRDILKEEIKRLAKVEVNRKKVFKIHKEIVEGIRNRDPVAVTNSFNSHFDNVESCYEREVSRLKN